MYFYVYGIFCAFLCVFFLVLGDYYVPVHNAVCLFTLKIPSSISEKSGNLTTKLACAT